MGLAKCVLLLSAAVAASGFELGDTDVVFHLFTRVNPSVSQPLFPTMDSIMTSTFSNSRRTILTIHSNGESVSGNFNAFLVPAHLTAEDVNFVAVDWSKGSGMYTQGLGNAPQVGKITADFLNILRGVFGYDISNVRIVGVGLGGHIAGIAARNADTPIPHIVALDPSLHGWTHHTDRLGPDAAGVVEVLHTTAGSLGYDHPLGHLDFYANGGSAQPGCGGDISCSHTYAYAFYAESIAREVNGGARFTGTSCTSYENAITLQCSGDRDVHFGGTEVKIGDSGIYTFVTNMQPPFARG